MLVFLHNPVLSLLALKDINHTKSVIWESVQIQGLNKALHLLLRHTERIGKLDIFWILKIAGAFSSAAVLCLANSLRIMFF